MQELSRFELLNTISQARQYLQDQYKYGEAERHHPGDKACAIEHWSKLIRVCKVWFPGPIPLP